VSEDPRSIVALFVCRPGCPRCAGQGTVCENHPDVPWDDGDQPCCGGAGMPCPDSPMAARSWTVEVP
jgi:hypothetical protein